MHNAFNHLVTSFVLISSMALPTAAQQKPNELPREPIVGPMVGHVTETTASIWLHADQTHDIGIDYGPAADESAPKKSQVWKKVEPKPLKPFRIELADLKANTKYDYQITIDGKANPRHRGSFTTAPSSGKPARFKIAVTSCMKFGQPQASWYLLLGEKPAFHLTLGDTQYSDTTDPKIQWQHHLRYRSVKEHAAVLRNMPNYAMWDDHDYGPNNSDGTAKGKDRSFFAWRDLWAQPHTKPQGGKYDRANYFKYQWGDVEFFILDGRYHRSPNDAPDDENKRMLGDEQFEWLVESLKQSKAKFKVVASGSTLHHSKSDGWRIFTFARQRFFDAIKQNKINGVIYLSGDLHQSFIWKHHESDRVGYPLYEVVSSGIANSKRLSFATLEFDTTRSDPHVDVKIIFGDATVHERQVIRLSELQVK